MANQQAGTNYYEILEVALDAPQTEIHKAYQRAKTTYSQDNPALYSMFSKDEARELLRMIEEAYSVLGNQTLRKSYDESLMRLGSQSVHRSPVNVPPQNSSTQSPAQNPAPAQVESQHRALPDFNAPEPSANGGAGSSSSGDMGESYSVRKKESAKNGLPAGTGRTAFSTYKLDESFENELSNCSDFDGALLQKVRLYKNLSLDKVSEVSRISRTYLMAVETNDYKALPAAVFVRGFVVQVARALGLDENKVASSYMKRFKAGGGK